MKLQDKSTKRRIHITVRNAVYAKLRRLAERHNLSFGDIIEQLLNEVEEVKE